MKKRMNMPKKIQDKVSLLERFADGLTRKSRLSISLSLLILGLASSCGAVYYTIPPRNMIWAGIACLVGTFFFLYCFFYFVQEKQPSKEKSSSET
jgi:hypothetical protein